MNVTQNDIRQAISTLGLSNQPLCIHSSLRSFITHCADPACSRCNDAVQGGPLLTEHV
jgi:hypothetical protein